jgi:uncharacterized protein (TIGR03435 family)
VTEPFNCFWCLITSRSELRVNRLRTNVSRKNVITAGIALAAVVRLAADTGADLHTQASAPQEARFDVVSVKRNQDGGVGSMMRIQPGGRFSARNLAVREVIVRAFGIQSFQLTGGSDWLQSERYDIEAKAADGVGVTDDAINFMLQALLADRFKLKVRRETRDSPTYELVFARSDRRPGEKLRETSADCVANLRSGTPPGGPLAAPALIGPSDPVPCGMIMVGGNRLAAGGRSMALLAAMLGPRVQRIVVDKTSLTGLYDFDLQFQPDQPVGGTRPDGPVRVYLVAADVPPLMTAIQDQLGLKLQAARGAVEYVVIESIQRPSEN